MKTHLTVSAFVLIVVSCSFACNIKNGKDQMPPKATASKTKISGTW